MSFQPVVPMAGLAGWRFLERTFESQNNAFQKGIVLGRDTAYFEAKINEIGTAEELVSDRRLLRVALGAFGLENDIDNRFFVKKVLEEGTSKDDALANRLADDRYKKLTKAFGFGDGLIPRTRFSSFGKEITSAYRKQQFELAVGDQNENMRLALYTKRELPELLTGAGTEDTKWYKIMGTPPLRKVFESALGLPNSFGKLDIEQQLNVFKEKAQTHLGLENVDDLADPEKQDKLLQRFLARAQIQSSAASQSGNIALTLLQSVPRITPLQS